MYIIHILLPLRFPPPQPSSSHPPAQPSSQPPFPYTRAWAAARPLFRFVLAFVAFVARAASHLLPIPNLAKTIVNS